MFQVETTIWLTFGNVGFVYEARQHVTICHVEVVMRTKHVRRDHRRVAPSVLLIITPAKHTQLYGKDSPSWQIN